MQIYPVSNKRYRVSDGISNGFNYDPYNRIGETCPSLHKRDFNARGKSVEFGPGVNAWIDEYDGKK